jgi:hypothetical protein
MRCWTFCSGLKVLEAVTLISEPGTSVAIGMAAAAATDSRVAKMVLSLIMAFQVMRVGGCYCGCCRSYFINRVLPMRMRVNRVPRGGVSPTNIPNDNYETHVDEDFDGAGDAGGWLVGGGWAFGGGAGFF